MHPLFYIVHPKTTTFDSIENDFIGMVKPDHPQQLISTGYIL